MTKGKRHTYPEMAAAGLWTTAEDLAKFAIEVGLSNNGKGNMVLSQDMVSQMLSPFVEDFIGLGIFLDERRGETYFGHGGWDEGFSSEMVAHQDDGYGIVVLINSNHPAMISELIRAVATVYEWEGYLPPVYENLGIEDVTKVVARYKYNSDQVITIYQEGDQLFLKFMRDDPMELFRIGENKFVRHEQEIPVLFLTNPEDDNLYLIFEQNEDDQPEFNIPRMNNGEKVPYEWLEDGNYEKALASYRVLKEENPDDEAISEGNINRMGYQVMGRGDVKRAIEIFRINVALYPDAYNTYDSLGEAHMENGDTELAILNYKKSLELNQDNTNAVNMLERLVEDVSS